MAIEELSDTRMSCPRTLCVFSFTTMLNHGMILPFGSETQMKDGKERRPFQPRDTAVLITATGDKLHRKCMVTRGLQREGT